MKSWSNRLTSVLMATMAVIFCLSDRPLATISLSTMALPDWAYAERQRIAPILVKGEVIEVACPGGQCTLKMQITQVVRNQTDRNIAPGCFLLINFTGNAPAGQIAPDRNPPPIGAATMSVKIPNVGDSTDAWLVPAAGDRDVYDLTAGQYGFGPNIESIKRTNP
jgi:hypothetical protein